MKATSFSNIRKWLWIFLLLVGLITAAIFLLIYFEVNTLSSIMSRPESVGSADLTDRWATLKVRVTLLLLGGLSVIALTGLLWLRIAWSRLNQSVAMIDRAVSHLAAGKLNVTVAIESADEFGKIGMGLNELAANLQELLLFIWKQSGQCIALLEKMEVHGNTGPGGNAAPKALSYRQIYESIQNLREMAQSYVFYDVRLEGKHALAINEPGSSAPDAKSSG